MRPILPPTVVGTIQSNNHRIAGLERKTFPRVATKNHRASVSFVGKQGVLSGGGGGGEPVGLYDLYVQLEEEGQILGETGLLYLFVDENSSNEDIILYFNLILDEEFIYGPGIETFQEAIENLSDPPEEPPEEPSSGSYQIVSAPYFASKEFIPDQIWVDIDVPITTAVRMSMIMGDEEKFQFAILPGTNFCLHRVPNKIVLSPTVSLRLESIDPYPATSGYMTIQVIGVSSVPFSQTVGLRFSEPE